MNKSLSATQILRSIPTKKVNAGRLIFEEISQVDSGLHILWEVV